MNRTFYRVYCITAACFLVLGGLLAADDPPPLEELDRSLSITVSSESGTAPLFEFFLNDPKGIVNSVSFDLTGNGIPDYLVHIESLEEDDAERGLVYRGIPYLEHGQLHTLKVLMETDYGIFTRVFEIAFAPYQFGRDNLSFANDSTFRNKSPEISRVLVQWAHDRFGELTDEEEFLLINLMYRLFRGNIGRCYGFSAGGLYYHAHKEALGWEYADAFHLDEDDPEVVRLLHNLQNDIVFSIFATGAVDPELKHPPQDIRPKIARIKESILDGRPVVIGYMSRDTHHSMVVFGYVRNTFDGNTVLLVANNWNRDQKSNLVSKDAVNLPVYEQDGQLHLDWLSYRYRSEDLVFIIDPMHIQLPDRDAFMAVLDHEREFLISQGYIRIIVESTDRAYVIDDRGQKRGYVNPGFQWGISGSNFRRIDDIYLMDLPADRDYELVLGIRRLNQYLDTWKDAHFYIAFPDEAGLHTAVKRNIPVNEDVDLIYFLADRTIREAPSEESCGGEVEEADPCGGT